MGSQRSHLLRLCPGLVVLLFGAWLQIAHAVTVEDALAANRQGDNQTSLSILKQLAEQGDAAAQYNLGLFYKNGMGTPINSQLAEYWFTRAAGRGNVNAYAQLTDEAIRPGAPPQVDLVFGPEEWIRVQNAGDYTLQVASSRNIKLIKRYYEKYNMQGRGGYFLNKERNHYALVYGIYPSVADATAAINELPEDLRQWQPWVRQLGQLQQRMADE
jgi:hypothetical protein